MWFKISILYITSLERSLLLQCPFYHPTGQTLSHSLQTHPSPIKAIQAFFVIIDRANYSDNQKILKIYLGVVRIKLKQIKNKD